MLELRRKIFTLSNYISVLDYLLRGYLKERRGKNLTKILAQKFEQCVLDVIREVRTFNNTVIKWKSYFRRSDSGGEGRADGKKPKNPDHLPAKSSARSG